MASRAARLLGTVKTYEGLNAFLLPLVAPIGRSYRESAGKAEKWFGDPTPQLQKAEHRRVDLFVLFFGCAPCRILVP